MVRAEHTEGPREDTGKRSPSTHQAEAQGELPCPHLDLGHVCCLSLLFRDVLLGSPSKQPSDFLSSLNLVPAPWNGSAHQLGDGLLSLPSGQWALSPTPVCPLVSPLSRCLHGTCRWPDAGRGTGAHGCGRQPLGPHRGRQRDRIRPYVFSSSHSL